MTGVQTCALPIFGILETVGLSWTLADKYVERIKAVTNEQVLAVAKKYLIDDRLTIADLYPIKIDEKSANKRTTTQGNDRAH